VFILLPVFYPRILPLKKKRPSPEENQKDILMFSSAPDFPAPFNK